MIEVLIRNNVYTWEEKRFRLLDNFGDFAVFIDIDDEGAFPFTLSSEEIEDIDERLTIIGTEDPWKERVNRFFKPGHKYLKERDTSLESIKGLIGSPQYWNRKLRGERIAALVALDVAAKSTLYRNLRKYWQRGQTPGALLPDYDKCGAKDKPKKRGDKKLGKPQGYGSYETMSSTPEIESMMRSSVLSTVCSGEHTVDKKGKPKNKYTLRDAYTEFLARFCEGDVSRLDEGKPSFQLFKAFYYEKFTVEQRAKAKVGAKYFNANYRKLHSTVSSNLVGPGYSYEIDSTPFDAGLAGPDRFPLGRPTLYEVVDSESSAVTGFFLTLNAPSYHNAAQAMVVAVRNKVELCREFGLEIDEDEWPMQGLPKAFFGDLGSDLRGKKNTQITIGHGTTMINSGAGQPEKRSKVERGFGRLYSEVKHLIPGVVSSYIPKKHGGKYNPEDYTLFLAEMNKILARAVLVLNSKPLGITKVGKDYPSDLDTSPNSKWRWGIAHRSAPLYHVDHEYFWYSLLERYQATLAEGYKLKVKGLQYEIPDSPGLRTRIFDNRQKIEVALDESNASVVYLVPEEGESKYIACPLTNEYRRFDGMTWRDALNLYKDARNAEANADHEYLKNRVNHTLETGTEVDEARTDAKEKSKNRTKAEHLSKLGNKEAQRKESMVTYNAVKPESAKMPNTEPRLQQTLSNKSANTKLNQLFMDDED